MAAFMPRFIKGSCPICLIEPGVVCAAALATADRTKVSAVIATSALDHDDLSMSPPSRDDWRAQVRPLPIQPVPVLASLSGEPLFPGAGNLKPAPGAGQGDPSYFQ